ncbi:MAG: nucleotidyltransferase domain-containing protein [Candidatus Berkelbacteria bacterium]|nr:nucleotidyltransferase domain-containing protein [Candidatus Berkelbacteria bacterium]
MPTVELLQDVKDRLVQQLNEQFCTNSRYLVVPFGSLVRGDATPRSDIDLGLAMALSGEEWKAEAKYMHYQRLTPNIFGFDVKKMAQKMVGEDGPLVEANYIDCVSQAKDDRSAFYSIRSSPTTYDHFGFFARDPRIPMQQRELYASIQREIAKFSQTSRPARERDIAAYLAVCCSRHVFISNSVAAITAGEIENEGYHILRKLAGLAKTFQNGDGKREIRDCFTNTRVPFFVELLGHFDPILQFGYDIEEVIAECLGIESKRQQYETFVRERGEPMIREAGEILRLVKRHIDQRTLLDAVEDYDREGISNMVVPERFFDKIPEWIAEGDNCFTVSWAVVGNEVILSRPYATYTHGAACDSRTGEPYKRGIGWGDKYWWPKTINRRRMNGHGSYEIDLRQSPPTLKSEYAFRENNGTDELLGRAQKAVETKLLELFASLNVAYIEPPPKPKPHSFW